MKKLLILTVFLLLLPMCGYHFVSRSIKLRGVDYFTQVVVKNETYEPELEIIVKKEISAVFSTNNWFKNNANQTDGVVFACNIIKVENNPSAYTSFDALTAYEAALLLDATIYKATPADVLFSLKKQRYAEQYAVSSDVKVTLQNKRAAFKKIAQRFSADMENIISQGF